MTSHPFSKIVILSHPFCLTLDLPIGRLSHGTSTPVSPFIEKRNLVSPFLSHPSSDGRGNYDSIQWLKTELSVAENHNNFAQIAQNHLEIIQNPRKTVKIPEIDQKTR